MFLNTPKVGTVGINGKLNMFYDFLYDFGSKVNSFIQWLTDKNHFSNITSTFGSFHHREAQTRH